MKELSIEEKAKAYDEAIGKLRGMMPNWERLSYNGKTFIQDLIYIFPELKESEDEKIRKDLLGYLHTLPNHFSHNGSLVTEWIAWLEKVGNIIKEWGDLKVRYIQDDLQEMVELKQKIEQGEQKPAEWEPQTGDTFRKKGTTFPTYHLCNKREDGITFGFVENREVGIAGGEITIFDLRNNYELVERLKPIEKVIEEEFNKVVCTNNTWSEEDENILQSILDEYKSMLKEKRNWLKSIKDRVQPQPKQEWSEEDKAMINNLYQVIDDHIVISGDTRRMFCSWLESLKDRVQLKQEWSEEDKRKINRIYSILRQAADTHAFSTSCRLIGDKECIELQDFLKSLRPQKPLTNEENEQVKKEYRDVALSKIDYIPEELSYDDAISYMKKRNIQLQYIWKPSDEQLECLGYAIKKAEKDWSPLTNNRVYLTLKALKKQLEKL